MGYHFGGFHSPPKPPHDANSETRRHLIILLLILKTFIYLFIFFKETYILAFNFPLKLPPGSHEREINLDTKAFNNLKQ